MSVYQKLGIISESKVVKKWVYKKMFLPKKSLLNWYSKMNFFWKNSVEFWHWKLTLKVWFWHFLTNHNSSTDSHFFSFEYVDIWPKILLFRTHHLWNSTAELILIPILNSKIGVPATHELTKKLATSNSDILGIHRNPKQKECFNSTEGFLRAALIGHGHSPYITLLEEKKGFSNYL